MRRDRLRETERSAAAEVEGSDPSGAGLRASPVAEADTAGYSQGEL